MDMKRDSVKMILLRSDMITTAWFWFGEVGYFINMIGCHILY